MLKLSNPGPFRDDPQYKALLWCFALGAGDYKNYGWKHEDMYLMPETDETRFTRSNSLRRDLNIHNREDMLAELNDEEWLEPTEFDKRARFLSTLSTLDRKNYVQSWQGNELEYSRWESVLLNMDRLPKGGTMAKNYSLFLHVCRGGAFLNLITEEEGFQYALKIGREAQKNYSSWLEFGFGYTLGLQYSRKMFSESGADDAAEAVKYLIHHPDSLWNKLDWNTPLDV